ncbi:MAG TPA: hypothetical protein VHQ02_03180 [Usitatibacter sp.]|nr:hypothetical protein [Usitatibacter sp.]
MRRAAKALVESRVETFEPPSAGGPARERVERALARVGAPRSFLFAGGWTEHDGKEVYEATFDPTPGTQRFLQLLSALLAALIAASAWALASGSAPPAVRFLLPFATVLAIVAMPLAVIAVATRREAEESRVRRAIRAALEEEP